jgi:hypothetical protein
MKRIVKSRLDDHVVDLYNRVDDVKKDISDISISIYKIERNVNKLIWGLISGMGALILTLIALVLK